MIFPLVESITKPLKETIIGVRLSIYHMMGLIFAAKTTFINPARFNFIESVMILSIVLDNNDTGRA
ncbi:MAG: hypothetical protein Q7J31_19195 [Syntrophales bacterium]|nr:hypothetical protein [Syntrophales bacterium]